MKATGTGYIQVPLESKYGRVSNTGRCKLIFPRAGEVYDFTDHAYAWVCGTQYETTANGWSDPVNVAGKKIRITKKIPGDPYSFAIIYFEIEGGKNG